MKKVELVTNWGGKEERNFVGFEESVRWKPISYYGGPKTPGCYYVVAEDGNLYKYDYTGINTTGIDLFEKIIDGEFIKVTIDGNKDYTDTALVNLARKYGVWYNLDDYYHHGMLCGLTLTVEKDPVYWLDVDLNNIPLPPVVNAEDSDFEVVETDDLDY